MKSLTILNRLWRGTSGNAALEFGLILPVLLAMVITIADITNIAVGTGQMQTAVRASVQYLMNGGTDIPTAQTMGTNAWNNEPADGSLTASKACYCSGASHSCTTLCSDNSSPQAFYTVTASGSLGGTVLKQTQTVTETVRTK